MSRIPAFTPPSTIGSVDFDHLPKTAAEARAYVRARNREAREQRRAREKSHRDRLQVIRQQAQPSRIVTAAIYAKRNRGAAPAAPPTPTRPTSFAEIASTCYAGSANHPPLIMSSDRGGAR